MFKTHHHGARMHTSKETFLNTRWMKNIGLERYVDRSAYETAKTAQSSDLTDKILSHYKSGGGSSSRSAWMQKLQQDAQEYLSKQRGLRMQALKEENTYQQATKKMLERVFDLLQAYALEFNQIAGWSSLQVTCTRPAFVTEVLKYNKLRDPIDTVTTVRARLSSRFVSLVIVGRKDCIEFRLLPVEEVIGLSKAEANYEPFRVLTAELDESDVEWKDGQNYLCDANLEVYCMELFEVLLEHSKGHAESQQCA